MSKDKDKKKKSKKEKEEKGIHLWIFQHGMMGSPEDSLVLRTYLEKLLGAKDLMLRGTQGVEGLTLDGIHLGGFRLAEEIMGVLEKNPAICKLSMVGHSMGGVYCRYAMGVLQEAGVFDRVEPCHFITFATPHLGSTRSTDYLVSRVLAYGTKTILNLTGRSEEHTSELQS